MKKSQTYYDSSDSDLNSDSDSDLNSNRKKQVKMEKQDQDTQHQKNHKLLEACKLGDSNAVEEMLKNGADLNAKSPTMGFSGLMLACIYGHLSVVTLLVNQKVDLFQKSKNGHTAFTCAAAYGHISILEKLLEAGANINEQDNFGHTALMWATIKNQWKAVDFLIEKGAQKELISTLGYTALILSARYNAMEAFDVLYKKGANIDSVVERNGYTALIYAARHGHLYIMEQLVSLGAKKEIRDKKGLNYLEAAYSCGQLDIVSSHIAEFIRLKKHEELHEEWQEACLEEGIGSKRMPTVRFSEKKPAGLEKPKIKNLQNKIK